MEKVNPKWSPVTRRTISRDVENEVDRIEKIIIEDLKQADYISCTVDIWTNRMMRGYMGITGHVAIQSEQNLQLKSYLLACAR